MPKKIEDVVVSGKRTIRDIPVPVRKTEVQKVVAPQPEPTFATRMTMSSTPIVEPRLSYGEEKLPNKSNRNKIVISVLIVLLVAFSFMAFRSGATLTYTPKISSLAFANDVYTAYSNGSTSALVYSTIKLSNVKSSDVEASGEETVSEKAKGIIAIFNEQSIEQQLVKNTRFETSEGKIFRLVSDITIKAKSNQEVEVIADQPGAEYNIGLSDFTLPGLKGTSRFEKVFARSKTVTTGGFVGLRKKVTAENLANAKATLEASIKTELETEVAKQVPEGYILFSGLNKISYELLPVEPSEKDKAKVSVRGDLNAIIFKKTDLAQYLAIEKLGANNTGSKIDFLDISKLNVTQAEEAISIKEISQVKLSVVGSATVIFVTDEAQLLGDIMGKEESELFTILKNYPSITEASAVIRPFWKSSFPIDPTKIKIESIK